MAHVCVDCVGDAVLRRWIEEEGESAPCAFCDNQSGPSVDTESLAEHIDGPIREFYAPGEMYPRISADPDDDHVYQEQEGQELTELLQEVCGIEPDVADAIAEELSASESSDDGPGYLWYGDETKLVHIDPEPKEWRQLWQDFEQEIKHRTRFISTKANDYLEKLIGDVARVRGGAAVVRVGPETEYPSLYRARAAQSDAQAREFVRRPFMHLGPPPRASAAPGRMNPAGITVFYSAFSSDVCIAEVRAPVGGIVVVGHFRIVKQLALLDLSYFGRTFYTESLFSSDYDEVIKRLQFLRELQDTLSRPVTPSDEPLEYIPTQAVAEFISQRLKLDGVAYNSAQTGSPGTKGGEASDSPLFRHVNQPVLECNVALFGSAARVGHHRFTPDNPKQSVRKPIHALELYSTDPDPRRVSKIRIWSESDYTLLQRSEDDDTDEPYG